MDQRIQLLSDWSREEYSISELSEIYSVSRKTIYKWIERYQAKGPEGLNELSRAPLSHPNATGPEIVNKLIDTKLEHKNWGPKKIVARLERQYPDQVWPAPSTAGHILKKEGLVDDRHYRRHTPPYTEPFRQCERPNDVWSMDYKGQFRMGDGKLCYPFTVTDNFSRFLITCQGLYHPSYENTKPWLEKAFQEYGLLLAIKNDNGAPFATVGLGGISLLSVWLIKLRIRPERIKAGHPEQNGRHERMHRTLKQETAAPPKMNMELQQQSFDGFQIEYNTKRPHEALEMAVPASLYVPSRRMLPNRLPAIEYPSCFTVRRVKQNGCIMWKAKEVYVSQALTREPVGLRQIGESLWEVRFSFHTLGILDEQIVKVLPITERNKYLLPMSPV
jgi:transposase InsO family protein